MSEAKRGKVGELFDMSTLKLKSRDRDNSLNENILRSMFKEFGIIDGVRVDDKKRHKAFVIFRYRDSVLKALN